MAGGFTGTEGRTRRREDRQNFCGRRLQRADAHRKAFGPGEPAPAVPDAADKKSAPKGADFRLDSCFFRSLFSSRDGDGVRDVRRDARHCHGVRRYRDVHHHHGEHGQAGPYLRVSIQCPVLQAERPCGWPGCGRR